MKCELLSGWLTTGEKSESAYLTAELREHLKTCNECRQTWQAVQSFQNEARQLLLSSQDQELMWRAIQKKRGPANPAEPLGRPVEGSPWKEWLSRLFYPALAFGVVLLASIWFGAGEVSPEIKQQNERTIGASTANSTRLADWAKVKGQNARLQLSGRWALSDIIGEVGVATDTEVDLPTTQSLLVVAYADGGQISIQGSGRILIRPDGFQTSDAVFAASFKRGKERFDVRVPGAVLWIQGTEISFDLQNGQGTLELISGKVHVNPEAAGSVSFDWQAGVKLLLHEGLVKPAQINRTIEQMSGTVFLPVATGSQVGTVSEPVSGGERVGGETQPGVGSGPMSVLLRFRLDSAIGTNSQTP